MNNSKTRLILAGCLVGTLAVVACSNNNDDTPNAGAGNPPAGAVPASAGASSGGFIDFLLGLANDETSEPLTLGDGFAAPLDDTSDPRVLT